MFSGLTNQVSSWMSATKGEQEEKVPTPTQEISDIASAEVKDTSPTKQSKLDMLSNVKTQIGGIGGWLGSSIPKFRKGEGEGATENQENQLLAEKGELQEAPETPKRQKDEDDNSSATGSADSAPQSVPGTPTEEKDGQFGNVQSKALAGAKSFGSFLYSAVNKAGETVTKASAKIKKTVEDNSILGDFNKEQEAFLKAQQANVENALPPWTGCANEEALKEECMSLSTDKRNFVRSPPAGVDFQFNYDLSYPVALAIMEQDSNLEKMRFDLVPKVISEEQFWRNYFYRVSLICQASELSYTSQDGENQYDPDTTSDQPAEEELEQELERELLNYEFVPSESKDYSNNLDDLLEGTKIERGCV